MQKTYPLGAFAGLKLLARPSAFIGFILIGLGVTAFARLVAGFSLGQALASGLACACAQYVSELLHNLGHAWAARRAGYPMQGVLFWGVLATSLYPANEGELPARVHVRRALGGPLSSLVVTLVAGAIAILLGSQLPPAVDLVIAFVFWINLLIFTLGALLPLGFTDGSTLLKWWSKQNAQPR